MATGILVRFDFVHVAVLLPPVPVEILADVIERLFDGVGSYSEIGIRKTFAHRIDIVFEANVETLADIRHQVADGAFVSRLKGLCCSVDGNGSQKY